MILIAASNKDQAGTNIKQQILNHYPFQKTNQTFQNNPTYQAEINHNPTLLVTLSEEATHAQTLPTHFPNTQLIIFISRHASASGTPTLSVHTPGNLTTAELGGLPNTVSTAPATTMQTTLKALKHYQQEMNLDYAVSYECTHHGPSLNTPTMFTELGSSPQQWSDTKAATAVAYAAIAAITAFPPPTNSTAALGIGGTHYNQHFTQMALTDKATFSHMIPKHAIPHITPDLLNHLKQRTMETVTHAILDWKGIKSQNKPTLLAALQDANLPYAKA